MVLDASGNLYGTTQVGGANGDGTVFELSPGEDGAWTETIPHNFDFGAGDGADPDAAMTFDAQGNLYGTTSEGGTGICNVEGCGTVFELSPQSDGTWTETILHNFVANGTDGYEPGSGTLVFDSKGNLYDTIPEGGTYGYGVVYELSPVGGGTWTETILHSFNPNGTDGYFPKSGVILDPEGNLYGTTYNGGSNDGNDGTVYKLSPANGGGWTESILSNLGGTDGPVNPAAGLVFDAKGNLWGTTQRGGAYGYGTAYELRPAENGSWRERVVTNFEDIPTDKNGETPFDALTVGPRGYLYGTTSAGGRQHDGTVFEILP
ncbi:MAG: choice-of-anchor tandem repeat GloVer-containing protein [Candidatus Sulfotelmatobacter sp.]